MDYVFLGKTLPVENVRARLLFTDDRLQLSDVQGALFSGAIKGTADISLAHGDPHYHANLAVEGIDFPRLTNLYFKYRTAQGHMSGDYDFTGLGDNARSMRGSGKIRVDNGDVFAIPVFGPLSRLISAIIPGSGYSVAHNAVAAFSDQGWRHAYRRFQGERKTFRHARPRRHSFSRRQTRFRCPHQRESSRRHGADAGLQTFRIQRRRQPLQTKLASEAILGIAGWRFRIVERKDEAAKIFPSLPTSQSAIDNSARRAHVDRWRRSHGDRARMLDPVHGHADFREEQYAMVRAAAFARGN